MNFLFLSFFYLTSALSGVAAADQMYISGSAVVRAIFFDQMFRTVAHPFPNFTRDRRCEIWPQLSTLIT